MMSERRQGRRSAQAAEATKYQIMKAAADMFCSQGYERVSLRNISDAAGVSHSLIRHHFGSKEKIWYAISDTLHDYMHSYMLQLIESIPASKPSNVRLYEFAVRMLAHMLLVPKPLQFTADVVRQEGEFFDYMVDKHGNIEPIFFELFDEFHAEFPDSKTNKWEQKWLLITSAHAAISLNPFMKEIWSDCADDPEMLLMRHWELFNRQTAATYLISEDEMLSPASLKELLLPMAACWENDECCSEEKESEDEAVV